MGTQIVGVVVANFVVLLATNLAFDAWVRQTLGYLDLDMVGVGGVLWVVLVVVATTLVAIGISGGLPPSSSWGSRSSWSIMRSGRCATARYRRLAPSPAA